MGNCVSSARLRRNSGPLSPELLYTKPSGLYPTCSWDPKHVRRLILRGELVPRYPGRDNPCATAREECPICMLVYPLLNQTRCCNARLCTECYLQIRPPRHNKEPCPFCKRKRVEACCVGPRDEADVDREEADRVRALEAYKRLSESHPLVQPANTSDRGADDAHTSNADADDTDANNINANNSDDDDDDVDDDDDCLTRDAASSHAGATVDTSVSHTEASAVPSHPPGDETRGRPADAHICPRGDCPPHHLHYYPHQLFGASGRRWVPIPTPFTLDSSGASASASTSASAGASSLNGQTVDGIDVALLPPCASCAQCNGSWR